MNEANLNPDISMEYFENALASDSVEDMSEALEHLIHWHKSNRTELTLEYGLQFGEDNKILPVNRMQLDCMEGTGGVIGHERVVGPWMKRNVRIYKGKEFSL